MSTASPVARLLRIAIFSLSVVLVGGCTTPEDEPRLEPDTTQADTQDTVDIPDGEDVLPLEPGTPITPDLGERQVQYDALRHAVEAARSLSADEVLARHPLTLRTDLEFDPLVAHGLDLVQGSSLALDTAEQDVLARHGFVITDRLSFPTFSYGYETIYMEDLPLFVSADSLLFAVHRSYDDILKTVELAALQHDLISMLSGMRDALAAGRIAPFGAQAERDADVYLGVALSLLQGEVVPSVRVPAADAEIARLYQAALEASGWQQTTLFGVARDIDFSQFTPRGHYKHHPELERYFRAMMWLGRIDLRLVETQSDHTRVFHRRQFEAMVALHALMGSPELQAWRRVDDTIRAFVGESDNMTPLEVEPLLAALGNPDAAALAAMDDATIAQAIVDGGYGLQQIASHIMINAAPESGPMALNSSFLLLGQRYVLDSHVFSNVVYDRIPQYRMMPDPLDVAFAALGNDQALALLEPELREYQYAGDLEAMRLVADAHGSDFWSANLYNLWLSALRELSPRADELADPAAHGLPATMASKAWGQRMLNTQLASWAELRHDTLLYAKQSYTGGTTCEFPDAYVDPYPGFYAALGELAKRGKSVTSALDLRDRAWVAESIDVYFTNLLEVSEILGEMAQYQRQGIPFTPEHLVFINQAVRIQWGCGDPAGIDGWYSKLFYSSNSATDFDPTIADVHTQPTDENGNAVGRVLHVGTGLPRLMVVTVETCNGPRAYVGLASSYFEVTTEQFDRLDDQRWSQQLMQQGTPDDVEWMRDIVVR